MRQAREGLLWGRSGAGHHATPRVKIAPSPSISDLSLGAQAAAAARSLCCGAGAQIPFGPEGFFRRRHPV